MLLSEYDYNLPEELIAQMPADKRENSKMLVLDRKNKSIEHKHFYNIVDMLDENYLLVMNNTKVMPARLIGYKDSGAKIEVFLLKQKDTCWDVLIKPSKRVKIGTYIISGIAFQFISDKFTEKVETLTQKYIDKRENNKV